jgi:transcriptional antiterminator Rof (Rho-off)
VFETIDDNETSGLSDEHVRLQQKDGEVIEGKVLKSNSDRLIIEYIENNVTATLEVKADNIRKLERLIKQTHH